MKRVDVKLRGHSWVQSKLGRVITLRSLLRVWRGIQL